MSREIDRDARDMLNRYNNKRRQLWEEHNHNPEWKQANDHKLVLPLAPFSNNTGRLKVKKGDTYEFDLNPWYVHFTPFTQNNTGFKFFLLTFRMSPAVMINGDWNNPEFERSATFPQCWLIFPSENIEEESIISFIEEMEGMSDENVDFPMIPVGNGGEHGHMMVDDLFEGMGIDETRDGRRGEIMTLRTYLQIEEAYVSRRADRTIAKDALFSYDNNPLMFEKIIVFDKEDRTNIGNVGMVFWLKNYSYIGTTGNETTENVIKLLYGSTTTKETINRQPRTVRHSILTALDKKLGDGRQLDSDVKGYIGQFGGKKKKRSLKKNKKSKRRKSLKKKRKTKKIKNRGAGGPFSSIFSKKPLDTFGRESSAVREPTEEEEYPFEDAHRWRFDPRKYAEPRWESDEQRFVRLDNRDREFGHGPYINSKNEIVPAPSKRHYATQANIDLANAYMKNKNEIKHKKNVEHNKHVVTNPLHEGGKTKRKGRR